MGRRDEGAETVLATEVGNEKLPNVWNLDLRLAWNKKMGNANLGLMADLFNVFNKQTGYDIQPAFHNSAYGTPRTYYDPRRFQVAARLQF